MTLILIGITGLIFLMLVVYLGMRRAKKRVYLNVLETLELQKIEVSNKPVMFELAKLKSVRKSERIVKLVAEWEKRWEELEEELVTIEDNISYAEETISSREFERTDEIVEITEKDLVNLSEKADKLLREIENLKSSELRNRDGIVKLRENSTNLNARYANNRETYRDASMQIEESFADVEQLFTQFDEHMEDSNYDLADEIIDKLHEKLDLIEKVFEKIPLYRESIEVDIKPMLDGILDSHNTMLEDGMYLSHLRIESTVIRFKKGLESISEMLRAFDFEAIENLLIEIPNEAKKLRDAMKNEIDLKEAFEKDVAQLKVETSFVVKENASLNDRYDAIKDSCLLKSDDEANFKALGHEINILDAGVKSLLQDVEEGESALSDMHTSVLGYLSQLEEVSEQLRIFSVEIATLYSDSKEIKEQAIQLLSDINRLKSDFEKTPVEKNVLTFKGLLDQADDRIIALLEELGKVPLDVASVKSNLLTATESFSKAQQEVALKTEQLKMAERLLVYGNRYIEREGMYLMDLTIAEDQYHQGNYETVIDKMYKILVDVEGNSFFATFEDLKTELNCKVI